ncbi:methyltransferase [Thermocatellispora tengchongensis]|uniref:Methyltransferase n=2 Tax=Thermocatellispora tengchongensis TaxID=1073253 RepID=A0A840PCI1_9ACTN|nr:isoprenylcysteine carboxyl methyltransferase family protein [Thermocatellispora tengchongensis]MBB5139134.1 methyltransferase [Thermocatellispora tengchongensis]
MVTAPMVTMTGSAAWYLVLIALVCAERIAELAVSRRNLARARRRGGVEYGREHYPYMVLAHAGLLVAAPAEVVLLDRPFLPWLGWPMLAVVLLAQALRWWCVKSLGERWNTRVVVVPGMPLVHAGPYRWLRHPNYVAVVAEGLALPLVHTAWMTALTFCAVNAWLLAVRIRVEDTALGRAAAFPGAGLSPDGPAPPR